MSVQNARQDHLTPDDGGTFNVLDIVVVTEAVKLLCNKLWTIVSH